MVGKHVLVVVAIATMLAGCADLSFVDSEHTRDSKSVGNVKDSFGYSLSAQNKTKVETYKWENGATKAVIGYSGSVREGRLDLTIKDGVGLVVYEGSYTGTDSQGIETQRGLSGTWTIELAFDDYSGALGLAISADYP